MKTNTIKWIAFVLFAVIVTCSSFWIKSYLDKQKQTQIKQRTIEVVGNYDYGEKIAKKAYGRGCLGCHAITKFQGSNSAEMLERILESWHISSFTDEDLRDLSVYLSNKANQE